MKLELMGVEKKKMNLTKIHFRELMILFVILLIAKWGINVVYEEEYLNLNSIKYSISTISMKHVDTEEFADLVQPKSNQDKVSLIYMGRRTCPVCVKLMPEVKKIFNDNKFLKNGDKVEQYYFDSEKYKSKQTQQLRKLIGANYVPSIIVVIDDSVTVYDSDSIGTIEFEEVLTNILNKNNEVKL